MPVRSTTSHTRPVPRAPSVEGQQRSNASTHWEGCWEAQGHHECAVQEIERLKAAAQPQGEALERLAAKLHELAMRADDCGLVQAGQAYGWAERELRSALREGRET